MKPDPDDRLWWHWMGPNGRIWWHRVSETEYAVWATHTRGVRLYPLQWTRDSWKAWKHAKGVPVTSVLKLLYPQHFPEPEK